MKFSHFMSKTCNYYFFSSSPDNMTAGERNDSKLTNASPSGLYKLIVPLLRCEAVDVRDAAVFALSSINPDALK